jgi:GT2 family glycosyltransferase
MISYILPTRNRIERLTLTLAALGKLRGHESGAEVIVVDNASHDVPLLPETLPNGLSVRTILRTTNEGAASRNAGVQAANPRHAWVVMLDDDSYPCDTGFIRRLMKAPAEVAAVSADIYLPGHSRRESGGLPEVFIGCGVAIRRDVFLKLGGYDASFNYYAEEYDLAARMILAGCRVAFDPWFRVEHHKVAGGRDMNTILARLVRNNGWVMQRYAPDGLRREQVRDQRRRYRAIAAKESASRGFGEGLLELRRTISSQNRSPMPRHLFDRFTGLSYARDALAVAYRDGPFKTAAIVDEGKNGWVVRKALAELGVRVIDENPYYFQHRATPQSSALSPQSSSDALVIGTMSPGPMLDAWERRTLATPAGHKQRLIAPWLAATYKPAAGSEILTGERSRIPA